MGEGVLVGVHTWRWEAGTLLALFQDEVVLLFNIYEWTQDAILPSVHSGPLIYPFFSWAHQRGHAEQLQDLYEMQPHACGFSQRHGSGFHGRWWPGDWWVMRLQSAKYFGCLNIYYPADVVKGHVYADDIKVFDKWKIICCEKIRISLYGASPYPCLLF